MKILLFICLPFVVIAQQSDPLQPIGQSNAQPFNREWSVSFSSGWQFWGPATAIQQKMRETGWAVTDAGSCIFGCTGPIVYPLIRRRIPIDMEISYRKTARRGYMIGVGSPYSGQITGVQPNRTTLDENIRIWYGSFRWVWFSRNGRLVNSAGPALMLFQDSESIFFPEQHNQLRPGLHLSSQFRFINSDLLVMAVGVDGRWGWPASSRAFEHTYSVTGSTGTLPATPMALPYLNLGLQIGFKIN